MNDIIKHIKIYRLFFISSFMLLLSHRFNLLMSAISNVTWTVGQVISLKFLFSRINVGLGWGLGDMILLLAIGQLFFYSLTIFYYNNFAELGKKVVNGEIDRILTRPINLKFALSFEKISIAQFIPLVVTVFPLMVYGYLNVDYFTTAKIIQVVIIMTLALIVLYFVNLALIAIVFFVDDGSKIWEMIIGSLSDFNRVPLDILPKFFLVMLTYILPIGFVAYYPIAVAKGNYNFVNILIVELIVLIIWIVLSNILWHIGLKRYSSAG